MSLLASVDYWLHFVPYLLLIGGVALWILDALQKWSLAKRRRLTTVTARLGLFVSWIATAVALVLGGVGAVGFYSEPAPLKSEVWMLCGGLCAAALVVWLLGRGIYFVLAGSPPEEPERSRALP